MSFASALGRIVYFSGRVELLLGRLGPQLPDGPLDLGLSGQRLVEALRAVAESDAEASFVIAGYSEQFKWRSLIVHGSLNYANGVLWVWHVPFGGRGQAAQSYQFRLSDLERLALSWENLVGAAHDLLHRQGG